jgi:hypothetical protein
VGLCGDLEVDLVSHFLTDFLIFIETSKKIPISQEKPTKKLTLHITLPLYE